MTHLNAVCHGCNVHPPAACLQATAKEYGTTYGKEEEGEEDENDIRLETAADREAHRSNDFYNEHIPAPQVMPLPPGPSPKCHLISDLISHLREVRLPVSAAGGALHNSSAAAATGQLNRVVVEHDVVAGGVDERPVFGQPKLHTLACMPIRDWDIRALGALSVAGGAP